MSLHSPALPEPLHWFRFDVIGTRHLTDQCGPALLAVDHCVPVQGHSGPGLRFGVNAAQLVTWPMRSTLPGQPLQPALPDLPPPWTLALWIRRDSNGSNGGNSGGGATLLSSRAGGIKIAQWGTDACLGLTRYDHCDWACDATLPLDRWCHLGVVAQAGRTDFYIDGALAGQIAASIDLPRGWLGSSAGWAETLHASLSDLRLFRHALDGAQLRQLAAAPALAATRMRLQDGAGHRLEEDAVLDFGMVTGNCMASVQVQIDNEGDAPLLLTPQLISQPTSPSAPPITATTATTAITADVQFTLELPGSRIVPPRGRTRLIVHFTPQHPGPAQTTLTIDSNDAAAPLRTLTIAALGDVPIPLPALHVALAQTPVASGQQRWLGRVAAGSRKVWLLSLSNRGDAPLHFTLQLDSRNGQFACWQGQGPHTVAPGGTFCADLAFTPQPAAASSKTGSMADDTATLRIVSNDPDQPDFTFQLQAGSDTARARLQIDDRPLPDATAMPLTIGAPGGTPVGQRVRQLIRLHNVGNAMAHLANAPRLLNHNDSNDSNFALDAPVLLHLAAGATLALPVTFAPASRGVKRARLQLDWDGGAAELHLLAQAT